VGQRWWRALQRAAAYLSSPCSRSHAPAAELSAEADSSTLKRAPRGAFADDTGKNLRKKSEKNKREKTAPMFTICVLKVFQLDFLVSPKWD